MRETLLHGGYDYGGDDERSTSTLAADRAKCTSTAASVSRSPRWASCSGSFGLGVGGSSLGSAQRATSWRFRGSCSLQRLPFVGSFNYHDDTTTTTTTTTKALITNRASDLASELGRGHNSFKIHCQAYYYY